MANLQDAFNGVAAALGGPSAGSVNRRFKVQYKHLGRWLTKHTVDNDFHKAQTLRAAMISSRRYYDTRILVDGRDAALNGLSANPTALGGDMTVAMTILEQLGGRRAIVMLGATAVMDHENGLSMKFKGSRKFNYVKITLNAWDTYDVEFRKLGRAPFYETKKLQEYDLVEVGQLRQLFVSTTGLYLTL